MQILAVIPARSGSKGVKDKNIRPLAGKPLIAYSIGSALNSGVITKTIVSTDSEVYADVARQFGAEVPFIRPAYLAEDTSASIDVIIHALEFYLSQNIKFDAVMILQPTSPLRAADSIANAVNQFEKSGADALVSVVAVPHEYNPHWIFEPDENQFLNISTGEKEIIKRRQELPKAFIRDGSIYITKTEIVLNQKSLYGQKLTYIENDPDFKVNIDTEADWKHAESKAEHLLHYS
jgi:CMP-N,N'-diacetyllegionaminic acid synthase